MRLLIVFSNFFAFFHEAVVSDEETEVSEDKDGDLDRFFLVVVVVEVVVVEAVETAMLNGLLFDVDDITFFEI